jgi:hypothetical protein
VQVSQGADFSRVKGNVQSSPRRPASEWYVCEREVDMSLRVLSKSEEKGILARGLGLCYSFWGFQYRSA